MKVKMTTIKDDNGFLSNEIATKVGGTVERIVPKYDGFLNLVFLDIPENKDEDFRSIVKTKINVISYSFEEHEFKPVVIDFIDYSSEEYESYEEAVTSIIMRYPEAEIGHDGDLTENGDRTLVWACGEDSINDDGTNAIASIRWKQN